MAPRNEPRAAGGTSLSRPGSHASRGVRHVLVVEDDSPIRAMVADLLNDAGYSVVQANNGFEALHHLQEARPDLIVLDLMLPGMSGWQFLERSRPELDRAHIPVVVLSAIQGRGDYPSMMGVAAWLTKPVDIERFLGAVEALAGPSRQAGQTPSAAQAPAAAHVLVVEDEQPIRDLLIDHLADQGFHPEAAASVAEARDRIAAETPALIMLDLMLPGESGWTFLRERRTERALGLIPVLVISASAQDRLLEAKELGAEAFVSKPFDLDALSALVRSFVHQDPPPDRL